MAKPRVKIPTNPSELLKLAAAVHKKHVELGAASPLKDLDWGTIGPTVSSASTHDDNAKKMERDLEILYRSRDVLVPPIANEVTRSRDLLLALYRQNPKKLGDFGFSVDDTPRARKASKPSAQ